MFCNLLEDFLSWGWSYNNNNAYNPSAWLSQQQFQFQVSQGFIYEALPPLTLNQKEGEINLNIVFFLKYNLHAIKSPI